MNALCVMQGNLGKHVVVTDTQRTGVVTIDLRRQNVRPPVQHILLFVRWDEGGLGDWFTPDQVEEVRA